MTWLQAGESLSEEGTPDQRSKRKCARQRGQQGQGSEAGLCSVCLKNKMRPVWLGLCEKEKKWKGRKAEGKPDYWEFGASNFKCY